MSIVKDRIRPLDPSSLQEFLEPNGGAETEEEHAGTPSEPEGESLGDDVPRTCRWAAPLSSSPLEGVHAHGDRDGGHLDEEADTYMVLRGNGDGELLRVPLRDITSAHETALTTDNDRIAPRIRAPSRIRS